MHTFPSFDQLYEIHDPLANRPFRGRFEHQTTGFEFSRGTARPKHPVRVSWAMGGALPGHVIWTTSAHPLLVSSFVIDLLKHERITGWSTYPVRVVDKLGNEHLNYFGLSVTGRCGFVDLRKSRIVLRRMPGGHFPELQGHFFEESSWDGSDFCMPVEDQRGRASTERIVSERVVRLFKHGGIRNVRAGRLSEATVSASVYEIGLKHLLPRDFRTRVAAAYTSAGLTVPKQYRK